MNYNERWATKIITRWDKSFKPRWVVFNEMLAGLQNSSYNCLDIGCGENSELAENLKYNIKIGTDLLPPKNKDALSIPFFQSDLYHLPFKDSSYDLILLRFVVEHIEYPKQAFNEISRILKQGGNVLILTTNICSPIIFLPKLFPFKNRKKLILKLLGVVDDDIFPTFHHLNTKHAIKKCTYFKLQN